MSTFLIPVIVLGAILLLLAVFALLARFRGGRYLRPLLMFLAKVPLISKGLKKASFAQLERENPELARVFKKLEGVKTPEQAQRALALLSPAELRAYRAYMSSDDAQVQLPEATNRAARRNRAQPGVLQTPRPTTRKKRR